MSDTPNEIPIFTLGTVLFPGGTLPLKVFEQRYIEMTKECIRDDQPFGVCLIREGSEVGDPALPVSIGCFARIETWDMPQITTVRLNERVGR
jgi:Lon protease-like protein